MAIELLDEHEQGERVRQWLRANGTAIIGGVALGLALIFGWQWWNRMQAENRVTAAVQYQALADAADRDDRDTVQALAASLASDHGGTPYAMFAQLRLAQLAQEAGEPERAIESLRRASEMAGDAAARGLVTLRLARAQLAAGDAEAALSTLDGVSMDAYAGLAGELRGDALVALGRIEDARAAYRDALQSLDVGAPSRQLVEMKLSDVGGSSDAEEA